MTKSDQAELIAKLETRLQELRAKTFADIAEPQKTAMEVANDLLIEDIEDRLAAVREDRPA